MSTSRYVASPLAPLLLLALAGCGSSDGDSGFTLRTTAHAVSGVGPVQVAGLWLVYLASETFTGPTGTDLNGDGDTVDDVAVAVNMASTGAEVLSVATEEAVIVGDQIYLVVREIEDGVDWSNTNGIGDTVLLHWTGVTGVVNFVDVLDETRVLAVDERVYYDSGTMLGLVDETSIRYLDESAPTTPVAVLNQAGAGVVDAQLLAEREGLVFIALDETAGGTDLNGDSDLTDQHVLALLNGTDPAGRMRNAELALQDANSPVDAFPIATNDWLAAFLVDETAQGPTNLNDQSNFAQPLLPETCMATPDTDTLDQVLFFLKFAAFLNNTAVPVNTGLAGHERVVAFPGFVATVSAEVDANCDLNDDGDTTDDVARWLAAVSPVAPAREPVQLHALDSSVSGGSLGLSWLDNRLIAVVDEVQDKNGDPPHNHDGKIEDHQLVAWLDPAQGTGATWHFSHQSTSVPSFGTGVFDTDGDSEPFAGTSWLAARPVSGRLGVTFLEEVPGTNPDVGSLNTNLDCDFVQKDPDKIDALPVWADFESGPVLDWDGVGYAVDPDDAGIVIAGGFAFFRVNELDDNRDYNADGDENDLVLFRNPLTTCGPVPMATSSLIGGEAITTDGERGAAFLSSESQAGVDFDGDGDTTDLVVRYFLF